MSASQARRVRKLVRVLCANCDGGNCLLLDDGESCLCPQLIASSLICNYFRAAVLPEDAALHTALIPPPVGMARRCRECGKIFITPKHNTLFCPVCAADRVKRSKRQWARKNRAAQ